MMVANRRAKMSDGKRGRPPAGEESVKAQITSLFERDPNREWKVIDVIDALKESNAETKESSVRWMITEVKKGDVIHRVRNEGHHHIYKFGPAPIDSPNLGEKSALNHSPNDLQGDLAVLEEAKAVIDKLQALVERNQALVERIEKFKQTL
jgi:hypothetical protein